MTSFVAKSASKIAVVIEADAVKTAVLLAYEDTVNA